MKKAAIFSILLLLSCTGWASAGPCFALVQREVGS